MNCYNPSSPSFEPLLPLAATRTRDELSRPLRHTYIALLFGKDIRHKGCPPKLLHELLGHAIIAITWTRIHLCAAHRASDQTAAMESVSS
jgi:integrase